MKNKYSSVLHERGENYRKISQRLNDSGLDVSPSTVRNIIIGTMTKIASFIARETGIENKKSYYKNVARTPEFQSAISYFLEKIYLRSGK